MEDLDLKSMPLDDLWRLHEQISNILSERIVAEKLQLENRLLWLQHGKAARGSAALEDSGKPILERPRRKYPRVFPKYRNPTVPSETWSGRGKKPRWLVLALNAGGRIEDFAIPDATRDETRAGR